MGNCHKDINKQDSITKDTRPVFGCEEPSLGYFLDEVETDSSTHEDSALIIFHFCLGDRPFEERTIT